MKRNSLHIILIFALIIAWSSCKRIGYYDDGEMNIINSITEKSWKREYKFRHDGTGKEYDVCETYFFKKDGMCALQTIYKDSNGEVEEITDNLRWTFVTPEFNVIYFDSNVYWEIRQLTTDKLSVAETYNDPALPNQTRHYKDFAVKKAE